MGTYSHSLILFKRKKPIRKILLTPPCFCFCYCYFFFLFSLSSIFIKSSKKPGKKRKIIFFKKKKRKSRRWHILPAAKILHEKKNNTNKVFFKKPLLEATYYIFPQFIKNQKTKLLLLHANDSKKQSL